MTDDRIIDYSAYEARITNPLCERETINELRRRHVFAFNKGLGQNFLVNARIPWQIVHGAGIDESWGVLEIGPGIGCMTYELARHAGRVVAVEIDAALLPILAETLPFSNVEIVHADFMELDLAALLPRWFGDRPVAVVANLPYYITTPIVMRLLEQAPPQLKRHGAARGGRTSVRAARLARQRRHLAGGGIPQSAAHSLQGAGRQFCPHAQGGVGRGAHGSA